MSESCFVRGHVCCKYFCREADVKLPSFALFAFGCF